MSTLKTVSGTYGSGKTRCTVLVCETSRGNWYAVKGSQNVNKTWEDINNGVDVEELRDFDCFTYPKGVRTLKQLEKAINA